MNLNPLDSLNLNLFKVLAKADIGDALADYNRYFWTVYRFQADKLSSSALLGTCTQLMNYQRFNYELKSIESN